MMTPRHLTGFLSKCYEPEANTGGEESAPLFTALEERGKLTGNALAAVTTDLE